MHSIKLNYNVGDRVLFLANRTRDIKSGEIKKYLVESNGKQPSICYFIQNDGSKRIFPVPQKDIIKTVNNVSKKIVFKGQDAKAIVNNILDKNTLFIDIDCISFEGNTTKIAFTDNKVQKLVTSYCHPEDDFDREKGVKACLYKILINDFKTKLQNL